MAGDAKNARVRETSPRAPIHPRSTHPRSQRRARDRAAHAAAEALALARPRQSARFAPSPGQTRVMAAVIVATIAGSALAPATIAHGLWALSAAGFTALIAFRLAAALTPAPPAPPRRPRDALPVYTILAPLYRETDVLADLIDALGRLDYPADRLDVKLILEEDDALTLATARALRLRAPFEVLVVPRGNPRTKPRALNYALAYAHGDFVVIYDAEDRPHPDQLKAALDAFDAGGTALACVQAPLTWYNARETWLTRQFALEYAALFHVMLPALARWGWPLPLGGTSNHFRRAALDAAGGWDPHNVTEDADLGFRLAELGYRAGVIAPPTGEEAVTAIRPWLRQRSRWIKGFLQTFFVRMRNLGALGANAGAGGFAALAFTIVLPIASSFLHGPIALAALVALALGALPLSAALFLGAGYAVAAVAAFIGLARSGQLRLAPALALMPLYWPLQTIAAARAAVDLARRPFHWEKTRHGVTRLRPQGSALRPGDVLARAPAAPPAPQAPHDRNADQHVRREEGDAADDARERAREDAEEGREGGADRREGVLT